MAPAATAAQPALAWGIGFVDLVVPHLARGLVGARYWARVVTSAVLDAILVQ